MNEVKIIEFDEQQKARLTAALRAVAGEQLHAETVNSKPLIHDGSLLRPANEDATGNELTPESGSQSCDEDWEFLPIKQEIDTLENTTPSQHETLHNSVKYEVEISPVQWTVTELPPDTNSTTIDTAGEDVKNCVSSSNDFQLKETFIIDEFIDDDSDEEEMDQETELKLKELIESDAEDDAPTTRAAGTDDSVVRTYHKDKNVNMLLHYICPQCNTSCGSFRKWQAHTFSEHNFNSIEQLNMRRYSDSDGKVCYQCNDCQRKFNQKTQYTPLLEHRITHLPYPDYLKCRLCESRFAKRIRLWRHLKTKQHEKICKGYLSSKPRFRYFMELHCPLCDASQPNRGQWEIHLNNEHNYSAIIAQRMPVAENNIDFIFCNECKSTVRKKSRLDHAAMHERYELYKCKFCPNFRSFSFSRGKLHIQRMHLGDPAKVKHCFYCELTFASEIKRNGHMQTDHDLDKLKCEMCKLQFGMASKLLSHMNKSKHHRLDGESLLNDTVNEQLPNASDEESNCESTDFVDEIVKDEHEIGYTVQAPNNLPAPSESTDFVDEIVKEEHEIGNTVQAPNHLPAPSESTDFVDEVVKEEHEIGYTVQAPNHLPDSESTDFVDEVVKEEHEIGYSVLAPNNLPAQREQVMKQEIIEMDDSSDEQESTDSEEQDEEPATHADFSGDKFNDNNKNIDMLMHYICPQCNHPCGTLKQWMSHTNNKHNFNRIEQLNMWNIAERDGRLFYQCKDCKRKFSQSTKYSPLLDHRITHLPYPHYIKCRLCDARYVRRHSLFQHLQRKHKKILKKYLKRKPSLWEYMDLHCPVCDAFQSDRNRWKVHLNKKHHYAANIEQRMSETKSGSDLYSCNECKKTMQKYIRLEHLITHERYEPYKCKLCTDFRDVDFRRCWIHIRKMHRRTTAKSLNCSHCQLSFKSQKGLNRHFRSVHLKEKWQCESCQLDFSSPGMLLAHMNKQKHYPLDGVDINRKHEHMEGDTDDESICAPVGYFEEIVKEETQVATADEYSTPTVAADVAQPSKTDNATPAKHVKVSEDKSSDLCLLEEVIEEYMDTDDEEMDEETAKKLKELMQSDAEDQARTTQSNTSDGSVIKTYQIKKNSKMLMHYNCPQCNKHCGSLRKWQAHTYSEHNFNSIEQLNMRRYGDSDGKMCYQCNECQQKFSQQTQYAPLLDHSITHLPYPDYLQCRLCDARFLRHRLLAWHLKKKGGAHEKISKAYLNSKARFQNYMELHCPICDAFQPKRQSWESHLKRRHNYAAIIEQRLTVVERNSDFYSCNDCKSRVQKRSRLSHVVLHERYETYKCKFCPNFRSFNFSTGWMHIRKMHLGEPVKVVHCLYCELKFPSNETRNAHMRVVHIKNMLQCEICNSEFTFAASLLAHMNKSKHHRLEGQPHKTGTDATAEDVNCCNSNSSYLSPKKEIVETTDSSDEDELDLENENKLEESTDSDEEDDEPTSLTNCSDVSAPNLIDSNINIGMLMLYSCPLCNHPCGSFSQWQAHTSVHHSLNSVKQLNMRNIVAHDGELFSQCNDCEQKFKQKTRHSLLLNHRITHLPYPAYIQCRLCDARYLRRHALFLHLKCKHKNISKKYLNQRPSVWSYIKVHCPVCDALQPNRKQWEAHLNKKHKYQTVMAQRMPALESNPERFKCIECKRTVGKKSRLRHTINHERYESYECKFCPDFKCIDFARCWAHIRRVHERSAAASGSLSCSHCELTFPSSRTRNKHWRRVHLKDKLQCETCKVNFSSTTVLLAHMNKTNHYQLDGEVINRLDDTIEGVENRDHNEYVPQGHTKSTDELEEAETYGNDYLDIKECSINSNDSCEAEEMVELNYESDVEEINTETDTQTQSDVEHNELMMPLNDTEGTEGKSNKQSKSFDMLMVYTCPQCNHACGSFQKWHAHTFNEHNFNSIEQLNVRRFLNEEGKMCYECKDCQQKFSQRTQYAPLLNHRITHLPYADYIKCRLCNAGFATRLTILGHFRSKHKKINNDYRNQKISLWDYINLYCPLCGVQRADRRHWEAHLNLKHSYSAIVEQRMPVVETDSYLYSCNECKNTYPKHKCLEHIVTHEQNESYKCKYCANFSSFDVGRCWTHVLKVHLDKPAKILHCPYCELTFRSRYVRDSHIQDLHLKDTLQCDMCEMQFAMVSSLLTHMNQSKHHRLEGEVDEHTESAADGKSNYVEIVKEEPEIDTPNHVVMLPIKTEDVVPVEIKKASTRRSTRKRKLSK